VKQEDFLERIGQLNDEIEQLKPIVEKEQEDLNDLSSKSPVFRPNIKINRKYFPSNRMPIIRKTSICISSRIS
jgi:hypothetical protein